MNVNENERDHLFPYWVDVPAPPGYSAARLLYLAFDRPRSLGEIFVMTPEYRALARS